MLESFERPAGAGHEASERQLTPGQGLSALVKLQGAPVYPAVPEPFAR